MTVSEAFNEFLETMKLANPPWDPPERLHDTLLMAFSAGAAYGSEEVACGAGWSTREGEWLRRLRQLIPTIEKTNLAQHNAEVRAVEDREKETD